MMFFFKKKNIVVDCFTTSVTAYKYHPIKKASEFLPEWWKKVPAYNNVSSPYSNNMMVERTSIKKCTGFTSLYKNGFILHPIRPI